MPGWCGTTNILSVLMQCIAMAAVASVLWLAAGYSLAFAEGNALVGGLSKAVLLSVPRGAAWPDTGLPETLFFMFQMHHPGAHRRHLCGAHPLCRGATVLGTVAAGGSMRRLPTGCGAAAGWRRWV